MGRAVRQRRVWGDALIARTTVVAKSMNGRATPSTVVRVTCRRRSPCRTEAVSLFGTADPPSLRACLLARRAELRAEACGDMAAMRDRDAAERVLGGATTGGTSA
jgi:hypothetical protein